MTEPLPTPPSASSAAATPLVLHHVAGRLAGGSVTLTADAEHLAADGERMPAAAPIAGLPLARLRHQPDGWWLDALHGAEVRVGGAEVIAPVRLVPGARIALGAAELLVDAPTAAPVSAQLTAIEGALRGRAFPLAGERAVIGRADVPVPIGEDASAQEHAELRLQDGAWTVAPKEARCLLILNGERIARATRLKTGDRLRIGQSVLVFADARLDALPGTSLGEVTLGARVGCGSLGAVFRAQDASGTALAVKVLDPGLAGDLGASARFVNGARNQQRLSHGNVVRVIGVHADGGAPAAIMEWLPGGALAERLADGRKLAAPAAVALLRDAAHGLAAGVKLRLYHQGLRPANLLFDAHDRVQVADFALCAPYDPLAPAAGGDPRYAAPEEVTGAAADALANQFSLGLILFHALTGRPPFTGGSRDELARARIDGALPTIRSLVEVAPSLEHLLARMLARRRDGRFASWDEVLAAVDAFQSGAAIPEPPSGVSVLGGRPRSNLVAMPSGRTPPPPVPEARASARRGTAEGSSVATAAARPSSGLTPAVGGPSSVPRLAPARRSRGLREQLGIPANAVSGLILVATLVAALLLYSALRSHPATLPPTADLGPGAGGEEPPAPALPVIAAPAAPPPPAAPSALGAAPALTPTVVAATLVGGAGDQAIERIGIADDGRIVASGTGFTVIYSADGRHGEIQGDPATDAPRPYSALPPLPVDAPRTAKVGAVTLGIDARPVNGVAHQPALRASTGWHWWDWPAEAAASRGLGADSRGYDVWAMPDGSAMVLAWSAAANSVLAQMPQDLDRPLPGPRPDGAASLYARVDPVQGRLLSALFLPAPPTAHAIDPWGRVYVPARVGAPDAHLGFSGRAGLVVLTPELDGLALNLALGGQSAEEPGAEAIGAIALHGNLLILGGTTAAKRLPVRNPVQRVAGSGQDGLLIILRLWDEAPAAPAALPARPATPAKAGAPTAPTPSSSPLPAPTPGKTPPADNLRDGLSNAL